MEDAMLHRAVLLAIAAVGLSTAPAAADVISDWNEKTVAFVTAAQLPPPQAERVLAMVHLAMFEAVNGIEPRYQPVIAQGSAPRGASKEAAAAAAAGAVLIGLFTEDAGLKNGLADYLRTLPAG